MLGDAGANALGAMLGTAAAIALPRTARVAVLAAIAGLTAASEAVSFTKVIERTPPLRWLDMLGRRPPAVAATGSPGRPDGTGPQTAEGTAGSLVPAATAVPVSPVPGSTAPGSPMPAATAGQ